MFRRDPRFGLLVALTVAAIVGVLVCLAVEIGQIPTEAGFGQGDQPDSICPGVGDQALYPSEAGLEVTVERRRHRGHP